MSTLIPLAKRIFSIRNLMWLLFVVVALVTTWSIFCVEERWRGERKWNSYRTEASQRGAKLDIKDFIPPEVPAAENFAATPLIQELFVPPAEGQPARKWFIESKLGYIGAPSRTDSPSEPLLNRYRDDFVKRGIIPASGGDAADGVLAALKLVEPEVQQLREAGRRPKAKFPIHWERGIETPLPHLASMQALSQLYRLGVIANLAKGDSEAAFQYFRDGLRIYTALRDEPALIMGLVRLANLRLIEDPVVSDGALAKWSENDLRQIASLLSEVNLSADYEFALESEGAVMNRAFDGLISKSDLELTKIGGFIGLGNGRATVSLYPRGWFRLSQIKSNQAIVRFVEQGLRMGTDVPKDPLLQPDVSYLKKLPYLLYVTLAPVLNEFPQKYTYAVSFHEQVIISCALERFRRRNNSYPEKLDALLPEFLASIPRDPADGAPMRYRRTDDGGFILWSIGPNLIDDGGKPEPGKSSRAQADWILQVPGKP